MVMVNENWQIVSIYCLIGLVIGNYFVFNRNLIALCHLAKTGKKKQWIRNNNVWYVLKCVLLGCLFNSSC